MGHSPLNLQSAEQASSRVRSSGASKLRETGTNEAAMNDTAFRKTHRNDTARAIAERGVTSEPAKGERGSKQEKVRVRTHLSGSATSYSRDCNTGSAHGSARPSCSTI